MLASYTSGDSGLRWVSTPEDVHVQYVVDSMAEIHGDVVYQEYTGNFNRRCWVLDEYETISWAEASAGMRKAYLPAFFRTEQGVILSGEGTSYTSSWSKFPPSLSQSGNASYCRIIVASALEAGVRASVQLLLGKCFIPSLN
jgi:Flavin containing amine oxidoreductase